MPQLHRSISFFCLFFDQLRKIKTGIPRPGPDPNNLFSFKSKSYNFFHNWHVVCFSEEQLLSEGITLKCGAQ